MYLKNIHVHSLTDCQPQMHFNPDLTFLHVILQLYLVGTEIEQNVALATKALSIYHSYLLPKLWQTEGISISLLKDS